MLLRAAMDKMHLAQANVAAALTDEMGGAPLSLSHFLLVNGNAALGQAALYVLERDEGWAGWRGWIVRWQSGNYCKFPL